MTEKHTQLDLFVSHSSEDKDAVVRPLAAALARFGVKVWYDEFTLRPGDSLSRSIDKGLARSRFGVVVLSPSFFAKRWPEYELRGLIAKEMETDKVILPIWHGVSKSDVLEYSPPLADKMAINSSKLSPLQLAISVIEVVRPDLFEKVQRRAAYLKSIAEAQAERIDLKPDEVEFGPIRHEKLSKELVGRVRLVRAALLGVYSHSMQFWIDGFRVDNHPSREVLIWEHVAACYLEYVNMTELTAEQHKHAFNIALHMSVGHRDEFPNDAPYLPDDAVEVLTNLWNHSMPVYDIEDDSFPRGYSGSDEELERFMAQGREHFPFDLPNDLVERLLNETADETDE